MGTRRGQGDAWVSDRCAAPVGGRGRGAGAGVGSVAAPLLLRGGNARPVADHRRVAGRRSGVARARSGDPAGDGPYPERGPRRAQGRGRTAARRGGHADAAGVRHQGRTRAVVVPGSGRGAHQRRRPRSTPGVGGGQAACRWHERNPRCARSPTASPGGCGVGQVGASGDVQPGGPGQSPHGIGCDRPGRGGGGGGAGSAQCRATQSRCAQSLPGRRRRTRATRYPSRRAGVGGPDVEPDRPAIGVGLRPHRVGVGDVDPRRPAHGRGLLSVVDAVRRERVAAASGAG